MIIFHALITSAGHASSSFIVQSEVVLNGVSSLPLCSKRGGEHHRDIEKHESLFSSLCVQLLQDIHICLYAPASI